MTNKIPNIKSLPGIKRDGTKFEGDNYTVLASVTPFR